MEELLFSNLRIDDIELDKLSIKDFEKLESMYHSTNVTFLYKYLRRRNNSKL